MTAEPVPTAVVEESRWSASRPVRLGLLAAVFALAFVARLLPVLRGGGLRFYGRYDDGVYYTASEALSFGHLPYRDYVLLHPPGIAVALLPLTLLGRLTSDPIGMAAARLTFMALGALSAVLVALVASRWGWTRGAFAGLVYAASAAAIYDEETTFVEPVATVLTLLAVFAWYRRTPRSAVRLEVIAGAALGLACTLKIWYAALLVAVVLVTALRHEVGAAVRIFVAGAVAAGVVLLPFFALAPGQMWTMVLKVQLGRRAARHRMGRVPRMLGVKHIVAGSDPLVAHRVAAVLVVLLLVALAFCLADRETWMIGGLFVVSAAVLMGAPSYFRHYGVLLSAPVALMLPVGLGKALRLLHETPARVALGAGAAALVLGYGIAVSLKPTGRSFPADAFAAAAPAGCIASDDPAALIQMDRLTQGFGSHCDVPVDVTGASYGAGRRRAVNPVFQGWLMDHLLRSDAFVVLRARGDRLSRAEERVIRHHPVLAAGKGVELRAGDGRGRLPAGLRSQL